MDRLWWAEIDGCVIPCMHNLLVFRRCQDWQLRDALVWIGHDRGQQRLEMGSQPLDGGGVKEIGIVFKDAHTLFGVLHHLEAEIKAAILLG